MVSKNKSWDDGEGDDGVCGRRNNFWWGSWVSAIPILLSQIPHETVDLKRIIRPLLFHPHIKLVLCHMGQASDRWLVVGGDGVSKCMW